VTTPDKIALRFPSTELVTDLTVSSYHLLEGISTFTGTKSAESKTPFPWLQGTCSCWGLSIEVFYAFYSSVILKEVIELHVTW